MKIKKTSRAKYEGTIGSIKRMDIRSIPERSVNGGSGYRKQIISDGVARDKTQSQAQRIFRSRGYSGESGSDPVELWRCRSGVGRTVSSYRSRQQGKSEDWLSVMSVTAQIGEEQGWHSSS